MATNNPSHCLSVTYLRWLLCVLLLADMRCAAVFAAEEPPAAQQTQASPPLTPDQQARITEAAALVAEGKQLLNQQDFAAAEPKYLAASAIYKEVLGVNHPDYASNLNNLAVYYYVQGKFAKAEPLYVEALNIRRQVLGQKHPEYLQSLNNLALLYKSQGKFAKAEPFYVEASAICRQALGDKHPDFATSLNILALLYKSQGKYTKAEPLYVEALAIRKEVLGVKHPDYATSLNNLALLYESQGNYAKAEPLCVESLAIRREVLGVKHQDYAQSLNNLALLYNSQRNFAKAEPLFVEALAIRRESLGKQDPDFAISINNLAALYDNQGNFAKAEPLFVEALAICKEHLGVRHPVYASNLNNLARQYDNQGNYAKAEPLYTEALAIRKEVLGVNHPEYAASLNNLAMLHLATRANEQSADESYEAGSVMLAHLEETAVIQSEQQQLEGAKQARYYFQNYLSAAFAAHNAPADVYSRVLAWKGAVTARQAQLRSLRHELAGDEQGLAVFTQLEDATRQLATQVNVAPKPEQSEAHQRRLSDLHEQVESLQKRLAQMSTTFATSRARQRITSADLLAAIPLDGALIDFIEYSHYGRKEGDPSPKPTWTRKYTAFVLRPGREIAWVDLGKSAPINVAVELWRGQFIEQPPVGSPSAKQFAQWKHEWQEQYAKLEPADALREWVWNKLAPHLGGAKLILISPDSGLAKLAWGALPGDKPGTYLLEERLFALAPVPQALPELLAQTNHDATETPSLLTVSAVNYGADPGVLLASTRGENAVRGGSIHWSGLPATGQEASDIESAFTKLYPRAEVAGLRATEATEGTLRTLAPKFRFVHLATHGFFADPSAKSALDRGDESPNVLRLGRESRGAITGHHPGLLSGIVLAGANQPLTGDHDDGILTALEVGELDLRGTRLITLSACETGLGATAGGEGVLGLQRALQLAGARTTVASLWKVSDDATRALMVCFYQNLWGKKLPVLEALRQAQLTMLRDGITPQKSSTGTGSEQRGLDIAKVPAAPEKRLSPYYWGAFVLSGDWR
jgi:CHAT domain-containing protein/tetratricopeptide (TPR) repeat protein